MYPQLHQPSAPPLTHPPTTQPPKTLTPMSHPPASQPLLTYQPRPPAAAGNAGQAARKAGAYGGSEVGSMVGHMVGPPVIGGIAGNLIGEKLGEKGTKELGLDRAAGQLSEDMAKVIGRRNTDKVAEITMTALGYSKREECVCCPCMPASQVMLFVMIAFFIFNCYRCGVGIDFEKDCNPDTNQTLTLQVPFGDNNTQLYETLSVSSVNSETNTTTYIMAYPCEFGFHYLVAGAAVWLFFLPFNIMTLFGNCWRQCCCCCCDPVVCCATGVDFFKRCCCECGKFSLIDFVWYSMCTFQVIWSLFGLRWLVSTYFFSTDDYLLYDVNGLVIDTVLAAVVLDLFIAGSEIFHKVRYHYKKRVEAEQQGENIEMQQAAGQSRSQTYTLA